MGDRPPVSPRSSGGADPALEAVGIAKRFGHVTALDRVSLAVNPGEVLALMGDNGAGKSTLVKILSGAQSPDQGQILVNGSPATLDSPVAARSLGIETVYQDLALADDLSAPGNLFLGRERVKKGFLGWIGVLDAARMQLEAADQVRELGARIPDYRSSVRMFSGGQRQSVAIARASIWASRVIIMDEPTAALGLVQTAQVAELIRRTRDRGIAVIVISHSVPFVFDTADRIVVLRLGRSVADMPVAGTSHDDIVAAITGASTKGKQTDA